MTPSDILAGYLKDRRECRHKGAILDGKAARCESLGFPEFAESYRRGAQAHKDAAARRTAAARLLIELPDPLSGEDWERVVTAAMRSPGRE